VAPRHLSTQNFARYSEIPTRAQPSQPPPLQKPNIDVAEQIEKLGRLRDQGLLTDKEFQSKKEELLSRL
jgi:hypothetical protein